MKHSMLRILAAVTAGGLLAITTGCQSTDAVDSDDQTTYAAKDKKEWRDAPVGSHMKRRVRSSAQQDSASITRPTTGGKVTEESDILVMPATAGEAERGNFRPGN